MKKMRRTVAPGVRWFGRNAYQLSRYGKDGKPEYTTVHSDSLKEVKALRHKFVEELQGVKANPLSESIKAASLDDIWDELESACKSKDCTSKTIGGYKKRFYRLFSEFPLATGLTINGPAELTEAFLNRYLSWYTGGYKSRVKIKSNPASESNVVKIILGRLKRLGFLDRDTYDGIKGFVKLQDNEDEYYPNVSNADLKRLFDHMEEDAPCYCDFFKFLLLTGRRPMETAQIQRDLIEWQEEGRRPIRIRIKSSTAKNRKNGQLELHSDGDIELKAVIINGYHRSKLRKSPYLFCNQFGKKISSTNQEVYIKKASMAVLGFHITARYFRKRYVTQCGLHRVPIKDSMARSGHKDVEIFVKHYQRPTQAGIRAVIDAVGLDASNVAEQGIGSGGSYGVAMEATVAVPRTES
jgi:integrase